MNKKALQREVETIQQIEGEVTKQRLWIARRKAGVAELERKADTRKKIQLGGTVIAAGLGETPHPELVNILAEAKGILDWERDGKARQAAALKIEDNTVVDDDPELALVMQFLSMPSDAAKKPLKSREFKYKNEKWRGRAREQELRRELERAGAHQYGFVLSRA